MNHFSNKNYFTMPNEIFSLGLDASEIAVYAYVLATKGGVTMYDYMKALQERFDEKQPEHLVYAVQSAREGLRDGIDAESRRKLLRLLDAQNALLVEAKLMSFTAGFKLAAGIAGELGTPYSFDADEEEKAKEMITNG